MKSSAYHSRFMIISLILLSSCCVQMICKNLLLFSLNNYATFFAAWKINIKSSPLLQKLIDFFCQQTVHFFSIANLPSLKNSFRIVYFLKYGMAHLLLERNFYDFFFCLFTIGFYALFLWNCRELCNFHEN